MNGRISALGFVVASFAIVLLFLGRWEHVTAFAVVVIMITILKEER